MSEKDNLIFIKHILYSIDAIKEFSKGLTKEELTSNRLKQSAIIREIEVIGEAAKNMPDSFKEKHAQIPWKAIIGTRDKMIHHYFGVDLDMVWKIVKEDLSMLEKQIIEIKEKELKEHGN